MKTRVVKMSQLGLAKGSEAGSSSPFIEDFDEELCLELEEVGKELDRYKAESSRGSNCSTIDVPSNAELTSISGAAKTSPSTRPGSAEPSRVKKEAAAPAMSGEVCVASSVSAATPKTREVSEEESECQLKALDSLKASQVAKLKAMVTCKTKLSLQKDALLKNFNGDRTKLSESLRKNLSQSKEVDGDIQSLNAQIVVTKNKIAALKSLSKDVKRESGETLPSQAQPDALKNPPLKTDTVDRNSSSNNTHNTHNTHSSQAKDTLKAVKQEEITKVPETSDSVPGNQRDTNQVSSASITPSEPASAPESLPKPSESCEARKRECEVRKRECEAVERLASKLAMNPSTKNLNTLWCKTCNLFFTSITGYIRHLELPEHLAKEEEEGEKGLHKILSCPKNTHHTADNTQEALGVEFLRSTKLIYCSLCECPLVTREEAATHSQSVVHIDKYKDYILNNTSKEMAFLKAKMMAFTEYCKRRKSTLRDTNTRPEGKEEEPANKVTAKPDQNKAQVEAGLVRSAEPTKTKTGEKKGVKKSENNSSVAAGKVREGKRLSTETPLTPQKINVNIKTEKVAAVGGGVKRLAESPGTNKRQKKVD